jgi:7-cyano-7-deazaguanine synthase
MTHKAVVVISGGMDSSVLLHFMRHQHPTYEIHGISFAYGQRHAKELDFAKLQCDQVGASWQPVMLPFIRDLFADSHSSLVTDDDVPEGHYAESNMKATVVPNRNMIMMAIAAGYAVSIKARILSTGVHAGDHFIYPDCRPEFFDLLDRAVYAGNQGFIDASFELKRPFIHKTKADIAEMGIKLGVDFSQTWSCYKGGDLHCGRCGTCVERIEAIQTAGARIQEGMSAKGQYVDPTMYEDPDFWKEALKRETVEK